MIHVYTDGGSRGNPGPAAIGVYIVNDAGKVLHAYGEKIGIATNNVAEYKAVIAALSWLVEHKTEIAEPIVFFMDSLLIASQIQGLYRVRDAQMGIQLMQVRQLEQSLGKSLTYKHVPREKNKEADKLVNMALDNLIG